MLSVRHDLLAVPRLHRTARTTGTLASAVAWEAVGTVDTSDFRRAVVCENDALLSLAESSAFRAVENGVDDFQHGVVAARAPFAELGKLGTRKPIEGAPDQTEVLADWIVSLVWSVLECLDAVRSKKIGA